MPALLNLSMDVDGPDIAAVVGAFNGLAYPYNISTSCGKAANNTKTAEIGQGAKPGLA